MQALRKPNTSTRAATIPSFFFKPPSIEQTSLRTLPPPPQTDRRLSTTPPHTSYASTLSSSCWAKPSHISTSDVEVRPHTERQSRVRKQEARDATTTSSSSIKNKHIPSGICLFSSTDHSILALQNPTSDE